MWDYERVAAERLDPGSFGYFAGGANDETTLADNVAAYGRWVLRPRVLCDVASVMKATTVLGTDVSMPILLAPLAFQRMAHPEGEQATARAAATAGTLMCLSSAATCDQRCRCVEATNATPPASIRSVDVIATGTWRASDPK